MLWTLVGVCALSGHLALASFLSPINGPFFPHSEHREERYNGLSAGGVASDSENNVLAAFIINIEHRRPRPRPSLGFGGPFGPGGLGGFPNPGVFLQPGLFPPGPARSRVSANIEVISKVDTDLDIIITERSFVGDSCREENFGPGFDPRRVAIGGLQNAFGLNNGFPGFGGPGGFGGFGNPVLGAPGLPFGGTPFGFNPFSPFGFNQGRNRGPPRGIIARFSIAKGERRVIETDNLEGGFTLENLRGRGVIGCLETESDQDGRAVCEGDNSILFCGTLGVDNIERDLDDVI